MMDTRVLLVAGVKLVPRTGSLPLSIQLHSSSRLRNLELAGFLCRSPSGQNASHVSCRQHWESVVLDLGNLEFPINSRFTLDVEVSKPPGWPDSRLTKLKVFKQSTVKIPHQKRKFWCRTVL